MHLDHWQKSLKALATWTGKTPEMQTCDTANQHSHQRLSSGSHLDQCRAVSHVPLVSPMASWIHIALSTPCRIFKQCRNKVQQVSNCIQKLDIKVAQRLNKGKDDKNTLRQKNIKTASVVRILLLLPKEALTWSMKCVLTRPRCPHSVWHQALRKLSGSSPCSGITNAMISEAKRKM